MSLRGAEGEPIGLLDRANPAFIQYDQDWQDLQRSPYVALLTSDISAIPQKREAILSEVTTLHQQLQELRDQKKGSGRALFESHQRQGSRHFWSFLPWVSKTPDKKALRAQVHDYDSQIKALEEREKKARDGQQGKIDDLNTEGSLWEARRITEQKRWAVSDGSYRVVRFAFEQGSSPLTRNDLFKNFLGQQRPNPDLNLGSLHQTYQAMVDEDLIQRGLKKPPVKEPEPKGSSQTAHHEISQQRTYTFEVDDIVHGGLKIFPVSTPRELAAAMLGYSGLQHLAATSVLEKLSHISATPDKNLARFEKVEWGHFKDYYTIPFGKRWLIYYKRLGASESFGIQRI